MRGRFPHTSLALAALSALALVAFSLPAVAVAEVEAGSSTVSTSSAPESASSAVSTTTTTTSPAGASTSASESSQTSTTTTSGTAAAPEVSAQAPQRAGNGSRPADHGTSPTSGGGRATIGKPNGNGGSGATQGSGKNSGNGGTGGARTGTPPPPKLAGKSAPPLPFSLRTPISGLPSLFLEAYDVPPFLLPIYQAAGIAYGVPWQVLAAINEVESDYGRDLSVSSAGAEGWMQFLPSEWPAWGVDATGAGYMDPYNPADAIFAAARYLAAAGGAQHIRAAVYAYNHSQAYVESVMLRAQLLGGMPPEMLGAVTDLAEARFPVHAPAHFSDGFTVAHGGAGAGRTIVGTTIDSQAGAPVIAVKDGTVIAIGDSPALGPYIKLRDAYGDLFTYSGLGEIASVYPVLAPRKRLDLPGKHRASRVPSGPATSGVQPHSPLSQAAIVAGFAFGPAETLQHSLRAPHRLRSSSVRVPRTRTPRVRAFNEGPERVLLRTLAPGARVIAGTVLGHLGASGQMLFQMRPGGVGSPLIDPKPLLDNWAALEESGVFGARGESPFQSVSPLAGQVLLESAGELSQQVLRDRGIRINGCGRSDIEDGRIDRRVLATLELLAVSGLTPTVSRLRCDANATPHPGLGGYARGDAVDITAVNGIPIASHTGQGGVADLLERRLLALQGTMRPRQVAGPIDYPGARRAVVVPASQGLVHVAFAPPAGAASANRNPVALMASALAGSDWTALDERLAEISDAAVPQGRSAAAVADGSGAQSSEEGGR